MRFGFRWSISIPLSAITAIESIRSESDWKRKGALKVSLLDLSLACSLASMPPRSRPASPESERRSTQSRFCPTISKRSKKRCVRR